MGSGDIRPSGISAPGPSSDGWITKHRQLNPGVYEIGASPQDSLEDKGSKRYLEGPYDEIHIVIHIDEPVIGPREYRKRLGEAIFRRTPPISRAFVLFSYDPDEQHCPLVELRFS